ncbi:hypothetical protein T484DRAFT_3633980 [Baffinella frigidus]|nr:hypothetical protein T484DRAFT_3633980 [Cryptophyta sp. CCMP2293]
MSFNDTDDSMSTLPRDTAPPYAQVFETPTARPPLATPHPTATLTTSMQHISTQHIYVVAAPVGSFGRPRTKSTPRNQDTNAINAALRLKSNQATALKKADGHDSMADNYLSQGKYEAAFSQCTQSRNIYREVHGSDHPEVAAVYNFMALVRRKQGRNEEALNLDKKSLAIMIKSHGAASKEVGHFAIVFYNMAGEYVKQGKYKKAVGMHTKSVDITIKVHGPHHTDVADSYDSITDVYNAWGDACEKQGKHAEALETRKKALDFKTKAFGPKHIFRPTATSTTFMQPVYVVATPVDSSIAASNNIPMAEVVTVGPLETDTHLEETGQQKKKRGNSEYNAYQTKRAKMQAAREGHR